jgi:hypothetical protein
VVYDWNPPYAVLSETDSKIVKLNTSTNTVESPIIIGQQGDYFNPQKLTICNNRTTLYYIESDGIYRLDIDNLSPTDEPFISGKFYGLDVNPNNGDLYILSAGDFTSNGKLSIYNPNGILVNEFETGIGPNNTTFY